MKKVIEAIKKHKRFLITSHINLEGDSIGSQLAMRELLRKMRKKAFIVDSDLLPEHYKFLPRADEVSHKIDKDLDFEAAMVLDCPNLDRTGRVKELITKDKLIINIDHHVSNERFGHVNWVDSNASSAAELIYKLFKETGKSLTKEIATYLYVAILTDTGSFSYNNTKSYTHEIIADLMGYGIEPEPISENVYERRSIEDIKLLGSVLSTIKTNKTGEIAYLEITNKMLNETGADVAKSEGFVNYARSIDKTKIAVVFREDSKEDGRINISFRSRGHVDVNRIASFFGGGGHVKASGCVIQGKLADVENRVLAKVEAMLKGKRQT